jgi:8-oxo-dGTP diphosphatase
LIENEARFCIRCGAHLEKKMNFGRNRPTCVQCGWVLFPDPKVAVAALIFIDGKVLLVKRGNEPHKGKWSFPAGFMDAGEVPELALAREVYEETGLRIRPQEFLELVPGRTHSNGADLLLLYRADVISGEVNVGDDADEARFFALEELPELAFENTGDLLKLLQ